MNHRVHTLYATSRARVVTRWTGEGSLLAHILNDRFAAARTAEVAARRPERDREPVYNVAGRQQRRRA
jgi:hypothetical protein